MGGVFVIDINELNTPNENNAQQYIEIVNAIQNGLTPLVICADEKSSFGCTEYLLDTSSANTIELHQMRVHHDSDLLVSRIYKLKPNGSVTLDKFRYSLTKV